MTQKTPEQKVIQSDIFRYKTNKLAANLALLGIVFNCLYLMLLYGIKASTFSDGETSTRFAQMEMGFSVILNLLVLLVGFLSSEGVKGYNKKFGIVLIVLAAFQIFRIFGYPLYGLKNNLLTVNYFWLNPTTSELEFTILLIYLIASAACFVAAAVIGYLRAVQLEKFQKQIDSGEISIDETLKQLDEEDAKAASEAQEEAQEAGDASEEVTKEASDDIAAEIADTAAAPAEKAETPSDASANNADEEVQ